MGRTLLILTLALAACQGELPAQTIDSAQSLAAFNQRAQRHLPKRLILRGALPTKVELPHLRHLGSLQLEDSTLRTLSIPQLEAIDHQLTVHHSRLPSLTLPRLRDLGGETPLSAPRLELLDNPNLRRVSFPQIQRMGPVIGAPLARVFNNPQLCAASVSFPGVDPAELVFEQGERCVDHGEEGEED